ncbi:helix-turn-helix transcriptional regulator, partial [Klebsiella pneumoniae]|uniref:helix-turn-helix transcriptional regulator n=1 Tax=Klebsiella pneumoniae TaxID=573 RepID=UPI001F513EC5
LMMNPVPWLQMTNMISYQGLVRTFLNAWVNQQRMASAKELLCHSDWSIASIARNLGFSQTSYFCKVFRQTYQVTPQAFRQQINAGSQTESF